MKLTKFSKLESNVYHRAIADEPFRKIARSLGKSEASVRSAWNRACKKAAKDFVHA